MIKAVHASPLGPLTIVSDGAALAALVYEDHSKAIGAVEEAIWGEDAISRAARRQLDEYFARRREQFDIPLAPRGPPFRQRVWRALLRIPFGATTTYSGLAARLGARAGARAVGAANGANPIALVIPCHRVLGADGALTGYAGGLARKSCLLSLERDVRGGETACAG